MSTELLYISNMQQLTCSAKVIDIHHDAEKTILILDQTVFYPQGGGQPYDTGMIKGASGDFLFDVLEVRFVDGVVHHIGTLVQGEMTVGVDVFCCVDEERRVMHTRLHSAGHVVDMALQKLGIPWVPVKGYHFPQGAYVEYSGEVADTQTLQFLLERTCNEIITKNFETRLVFDEYALQYGKPRRTVFYGAYGVPCGGTHVASLQDVGFIAIRKIKRDKGVMRVSYEIAMPSL